LFVKGKAKMIEKLYYDEKSCDEILFCILSVIQKNVLNRVRDSTFFGIMIDEFTYIFMTGHLIVFASFIRKSLSICVFLGLLHLIEDGKKNACIIFETSRRNMKDYRLDFDKCVVFDSDGASTMLCKNKDVAT